MQNNKINYNGLTIEVKTITPEKAKDILANHNGINRNVNTSHYEAILRNMKQGTWRFNGDTICFNKDGMLIDGQHRLKALSEYGKPLDMIVISGFEKDVIKTIDQEVKPRNLNDLLKMDGVKNANNVGGTISRYMGMRYSYSFIGNGVGATNGRVYNKTTIDEKYNEYYAHPNFYDDVVLYARKCYDKLRIIGLSDVSATYTYLYFEKHHSDNEIQGFFDRLCLNITDINVINLLRDILTKDNRPNNPHPLTAQYKSGLLTKTWNYYIKGKDVKVLSYNKNTEGTIEFI